MKTALFILTFAVAASAQADIRAKKSGWADLGVRLEDKEGKATIVEVYEKTSGAAAGLKAGYVVSEFNGKAMSSEEIMVALWAMDKDQTVRIEAHTGRDIVTRELKPDWLEGQKRPGVNNKVHHPPAIRAVPVNAEKLGDDATNPCLYAFDLVISFDWELTDKERTQTNKMIEDAGRIWYDALEGQMYWRKVEVHTNRDAWDRAHYRIQKQRGGYLGIEHVTPGGQCVMHFSALDRTSAWVWVHEAGHMQLGSGDEYPYGGDDQKKICKCLMGGDNNVELCIEKNHDYVEKGSCWDNAKRWYPLLKPVAETAKGPTLKKLPEITWAAAAPASGDLEGRLLKIVEERMAALREELKKTVQEGFGKAPPPKEAPKKRGYLGIGPVDMDDDDATAVKKAGYEGGIKIKVANGMAAEKAGLEDDDIIVEFEGKKVTDVQDLAPLVWEKGSGNEAKVVIVRNGTRKEMKVKLGTHPEDE